MKITHTLPQFEQGKALFIVTGKQEALFYKAAHGTIVEIDKIKIERPHYSDNEGKFKAWASGAFRSGSIREHENENSIQDFIKQFKSHIKNIPDKDYSNIYVMTPSQVKNTVIGAMPARMRFKIKGVMEGNHYHAKPHQLIEKIASFETSSKPVVRASKEAQKILHEADQASHATNSKKIYSTKHRF